MHATLGVGEAGSRDCHSSLTLDRVEEFVLGVVEAVRPWHEFLVDSIGRNFYLDRLLLMNVMNLRRKVERKVCFFAAGMEVYMN